MDLDSVSRSINTQKKQNSSISRHLWPRAWSIIHIYLFYRSQALLTCADHVEKVVTATPPIHFHTGYTTHSHIKNRLTIQVAYGFYVDISNNDSNKSCLLPAGGVTVDFLTLLMRLEAVEWLLGRLFESDLVLWSRSTESAFKELNRWRGGVKV